MRRISLLLVLGLALGACTGGAGSDETAENGQTLGSPAGTGEGSGSLAIEVLSSRPGMVTGGDAKVAVHLPARAGDQPLLVTLNGEDVTDRFSPDGQGRRTALLEGLAEGENVLTAGVGTDSAEITLVNSPRSGPVFSGPQQPLIVCSTEELGLGPPLDDDCAAETVTTWSYVAEDGSVKPLEDPGSLPDDVGATSVGGEEVPHVIREERGTINRSIYRITVLDPDPDPDTPWDPTGWNGRLVYSFGGGCGATYGQGDESLVGEPDAALLASGYAVATATFNTFQWTCNDVLSAETMMMVKEHFTETYGRPVFTIGEGASGGAIQQLLIAQNYPGLLDALVPVIPFPDAVSIAPGVGDCGLLTRFYASDAGRDWTEAQKAAVNGHQTSRTCQLWTVTFLPSGVPDTGCDPDIPEERIYDAGTNPDGLRCTVWDINQNVWQVDDDTGHANRPLDNTGVQYGLNALNQGTIGFEQFIELNDSIGSLDDDGRWRAGRVEADEETIERAYATGRVLQATEELRRIPIIAVDLYTDPLGDIHDRQRLFAIRDRLRRADGTPSPNYVIWTRPGQTTADLADPTAATSSVATDAIVALDAWLSELAEDGSDDDPALKLERARPQQAVDTCTTPGGTRITGERVYEQGSLCAETYPVAGDPRTGAGAPLRNDVLKCALVPVEDAVASGVYQFAVSDGQRSRLEEVFPEGVCDWSRPGTGTTELRGTWLDY